MDELEIVGVIEEIFTEDEDVVNELEETNIIDEPDADPTIPTEDTDAGEETDASPASVIDGDVVEADEEDVINSEEDNDLEEPEIAVDEQPIQPIVSNEETLPTIGNIATGDRVMIALVNGEATVLGTVGSGDRQQNEINTISADVAVLGTVVAGKASIEDLSTQTARIDSLETSKANVSDLTAATGRISTLETDNTSIKGRLTAAEGNITSLTTDKANVTDLTAATGRITSLETDNTSIKGRLTAAEGNISSLSADKADVSDLTAATARIGTLETDNTSVKNRLTAAEGNITTLTTNKADISALNAATARIGTLETNALTADSAVITNLQTNKVNVSDLQADYITANQIAAAYAKLDATNVNTATVRNAWIDAVMVQSGLIAHSGTIYTLDAIQLNADRITAGTIDVQRLLVTVNNHKYLVQFDAQGNPTYVKLDGDAIEDLTITADKIVAGAITAEKITTSNIVGTGGWINLRSGTFNYTNATSGNSITWDGTNLTLKGNVTVTGGNVYTKTETDTAVSGAAATATDYITEINQSGIKIHTDDYDSTVTSKNNYLKIDNQGVDIYKGGASVAQFNADGGRVGKTSSAHSVIDANGQRFYSPDGTTLLANIGYGEVASGGEFTDLRPYYMFGTRITTTDNIYDDGYLYSVGDKVKLSASDTHIYVCIKDTDYPAGAFDSSYWSDAAYLPGAYSVNVGYDCSVSAQSAFAEGRENVCYLGAYAHAEGYKCVTSKSCAHAEGYRCGAFAADSHAQNNQTIAASDNQTTMGKCNVIDDNDTYALIIGNGATPRARSNAFTVDWNGRVNCGDYSGTYKSLFDIFYPVGSYYETSDANFNPNTAWGGTWSLETSGLVHVSAGTGYTLGSTGGNKDAIIPYHKHTLTNPTVTIADHNHKITDDTYNVTTNATAAIGRTSVKAGTGTAVSNLVQSTGGALNRGGNYTQSTSLTANVSGGSISYAGTSGNLTNANMQPYVVVNRWHRTA